MCTLTVIAVRSYAPSYWKQLHWKKQELWIPCFYTPCIHTGCLLNTTTKAIQDIFRPIVFTQTSMVLKISHAMSTKVYTDLNSTITIKTHEVTEKQRLFTRPHLNRNEANVRRKSKNCPFSTEKKRRGKHEKTFGD